MGFKNVKLESMAPTPTFGTCEFDYVSYRRPNMKKEGGEPDKPGALPSHTVATDEEVEALIEGLYLYTDKHLSAFDEHPDVKYRRKEREQFALLARIGHVFKAQLARMRFKREVKAGNEEGIKEAIVWFAQCMFRARQQNREKERIKAEREKHDQQKVGGKTKSSRSLAARKKERLAKAAENKAAEEAAEEEAARLKSIAEENEEGEESGSGGGSGGGSQPNSPKPAKSPFAEKEEAKKEAKEGTKEEAKADPALTSPAALASGAPRRGSLLHALKGNTERRVSVLAALQKRGRKVAFDRIFTNGLFPLKVHGEEEEEEGRKRGGGEREETRRNRSAEKTVNRMYPPLTLLQP